MKPTKYRFKEAESHGLLTRLIVQVQYKILPFIWFNHHDVLGHKLENKIWISSGGPMQEITLLKEYKY